MNELDKKMSTQYVIIKYTFAVSEDQVFIIKIDMQVIHTRFFISAWILNTVFLTAEM